MKQPVLSRNTSRRVGSGLSIGGLVLVCVCFFLPCYRSCSQNVAPVDESLDMILVLLNPYLLAYALAGLLLLGVVLRRRRRRRVVGIIMLILCIVFLTWNFTLIGYGVLQWRDLEETLFLPAVFCVNGGLLGGSVLFILRRKAWRWRTIIPWSGLSVCLPATAYFLFWEWQNASTLYGMHLTVAGFAAATVGFWLLLRHHRAARRWTLMRWHQSRRRAYHTFLMAGAM